MSTSEKNNSNQQERERLAAQRRRQVQRNLEQLKSDAMDKEPVMDEVIEDDIQLEKIAGAYKKSKVMEDQVSFNMGRILHVVDGKVMSAEHAFNMYNWSAYIAAALSMYHDSIGWENANNELFAGILTNCMHIYGPKQDVNMAAVSASVDYIYMEEIYPHDAMRTASISLRSNAPLKVFSDAVVLGKTAMVADTSSGNIEVPEEPDLSVRATECMSNLVTASLPKPVEAMEAVIADLGKFDASLAPVIKQLEGASKSPSIVINETNPHRRLTKTPGLMSEGPVVPGKHGVYQRALECVQRYHKEKPDILVVPEYNMNATGSWDSAGSMSAVVPLPDEPQHYSLLLYSTVANYEDGLRNMALTEVNMKNDVDFRKQAGSARAYIHAPYEETYEQMRNNGQGLTPTNLRYTTLYSQDYVGTQDLLNGASMGRFNNYPVLVRAADFYQARLKSLEGSVIWIDLPMMVGLYFSPVYVHKYFGEDTHDNGLPRHAKGFYVMRPMPHKVEGLYSSFIEKYIFAHISGSLLGPDVRKIFLESFLKGYQQQRKGTQVVQKIIQALQYCYDDVEPTLTKVGMMVPGYSALKAFKNRTIFMDFEFNDPEFKDKMGDQVEKPPERVEPPPVSESTSPPTEEVVEGFDDSDYGDAYGDTEQYI